MKKLGVLGIAGAVLVVGIGSYVLWSGGDGEPSTEVTAPPVVVATTVPSDDSTSDPGSTDSTELVEVAAGVFEIRSDVSLVSFVLQEDLRGVRTVVEGTTPDVVGQIVVDFDDPSASQIGTILINARTIETGSSFRDRAIRGQILESADDEFEFITFVPTATAGLPSEPADSYAFTVTGDLTIRTITQSVTFDVTIDASSEGEISGSASAQVLRADFDLKIPSVPNVANVTDEVELTIEFVAEPA